MTGRELAEALLALPDPDAEVVAWNPGEWWELSAPVHMQDSVHPWGFIMIEKNMTERQAISDRARERHYEAVR